MCLTRNTAACIQHALWKMLLFHSIPLHSRTNYSKLPKSLPLLCSQNITVCKKSRHNDMINNVNAASPR